MNFKENFMKTVFFLSACICVVSVILISLFLFVKGYGAIKQIGFLNFVSGKIWKPSSDFFGIFPMIIGSIYTTIGAILFGVPLGILCGIYISFFCSEKLYKIIIPAVDLLGAIPSIVYGFFGLVVIVPIVGNLSHNSGKSVLTACILLGIMILPIVISITHTSLKQVPKSYYEAAVSLGATHEMAIFNVVVPSAKSGIISGVVLGIARAIGEAMAVVLVAGNQTIIPSSIFSGVRTLTTNVVLEMGYAQDLHRQALIANCLVLFVFIFIINIIFSLIKIQEIK